ncbi:MAG: hypothetical protein WBA28_05010 [Microbacteriaceae bacterium]
MTDVEEPEEVYFNPITGEVEEWRKDAANAGEGVLMPLNLGALSEDEVIQHFPTPGELEHALLRARTRLGRSALFLTEQSEKLKKAKRNLVVAKAVARQKARETGLFKTEPDVAAAVDRDEAVFAAVVALDDAALKLEYGRELKSALHMDIEILRSLNSNMRGELRPAGR